MSPSLSRLKDVVIPEGNSLTGQKLGFLSGSLMMEDLNLDGKIPVVSDKHVRSAMLFFIRLQLS